MTEILLGNIKGDKGEPGPQGAKGDKGDAGADGYTPQRGVDYFTEEEKKDFLDEVLQEPSARYANALKGVTSGYPIRIEDISPIEHVVRAKVSGDGITPENTELQVFGKNLIPYPFPSFNNTNKNLSATDLGDGGILLNGSVSSTAFIILMSKSLGNSWITGVGSKFSANSYDENIKVSYDPNDKTTYVSVSAGTTCDNVIFYPQIEVGNKITEYEKGVPYRSFVPDADGLVEFSSVSPTMSLISNTNNIVIDVEYNKDINKAFAELQNAIISLGGNV